jgi:uncharacterized protein YjdB
MDFMTFKHKLSCRLALMRDRIVAFSPALLAAAVVFACEMPVRLTDTGSGTVSQLLVYPRTMMIRTGQAADFMAVALTSTGDTAIASVNWSVTSGAITDTSTRGGRHYGKYKAGSDTGKVKIIARGQGGAVSDTATVTVTLPPVASVNVSPASASVLPTQTAQLTATTLDSTGAVLNGRTVTWSSGNTGIATVDGSGLLTGVAVGSTTVTASSEGKSASSSITVTNVPVVTVTVSPASGNLYVGQTLQLTATPKDSAGNPLTGRAVTWSSSNSAVAGVSAASGLATGTGAGSATITATSGGKSGTSAITVANVTIASVTVGPASGSLYVGQTLQLTATPKDSAGNPLTGQTVTWSSDNTAVATVSTSGLVTARTAGAATITAATGGKSGTSAITVAIVPIASVAVSPASTSVGVGGTVPLTAVAKDSAGNTLTGRTMTWSSSNTLIAAVTSAGLVTGGAVGSATITAATGGKSGTANVTVTTAPPVSSCGSTGSGSCYYVDAAAGNDANPGTSGQPFRTLQQAANVVSPGDGVLVNDGVYTGGATVLGINRSGTATNWIVFRAVHRWGAIIDGQNNSSSAGVSVSGNYIAVEGFEIRGMSRSGMDAYNGNELVAASHDVRLARNHIHDIGRICTDDTGGRAGIDAYASNMVIEENVIHDIGRLSPGEQGCQPSTTNWQNHDHGIYHGVGDSIIVRNNLMYRNIHGWSYHRYSGPGATARGLYIVNNTFAVPNPDKQGQIVIAGVTNNLVIENNVFYQPNTAGIWFDAADGGTWSGALVANNLSTNAVSWPSVSGLTSVGNIENTDPKFVNAAGFDFHLAVGSPAVDAGITVLSVLKDLDGVLRPLGLGYDIGAYESR